MKNNLIWIGTIVNTHGIKGEVRILSNSDQKEKRFKINNKLIIYNNDQEENLIINSVRKHKQFILLTFKNFTNINEVLFLKNKKIYIKRTKSDELIYDYIGYQVIDQNKQKLGIVKKINLISNYCVIYFNLANGKEINIPLVDKYLININDDKKIININISKELMNI